MPSRKSRARARARVQAASGAAVPVAASPPAVPTPEAAPTPAPAPAPPPSAALDREAILRKLLRPWPANLPRCVRPMDYIYVLDDSNSEDDSDDDDGSKPSEAKKDEPPLKELIASLCDDASALDELRRSEPILLGHVCRVLAYADPAALLSCGVHPGEYAVEVPALVKLYQLSRLDENSLFLTLEYMLGTDNLVVWQSATDPAVEQVVMVLKSDMKQYFSLRHIFQALRMFQQLSISQYPLEDYD